MKGMIINYSESLNTIYPTDWPRYVAWASEDCKRLYLLVRGPLVREDCRWKGRRPQYRMVSRLLILNDPSWWARLLVIYRAIILMNLYINFRAKTLTLTNFIYRLVPFIILEGAPRKRLPFIRRKVNEHSFSSALVTKIFNESKTFSNR